MGLWGYGDMGYPSMRLMGYQANGDVFLIGRSLIGVKVSCPDSPEKILDLQVTLLSDILIGC